MSLAHRARGDEEVSRPSEADQVSRMLGVKHTASEDKGQELFVARMDGAKATPREVIGYVA